MGKIHSKGSTWVSALHLPQGRCPEPAQYGQTFPFFDMQRPRGLPGGPRHSNHLRRDALPETIPLWQVRCIKSMFYGNGLSRGNAECISSHGMPPAIP